MDQIKNRLVKCFQIVFPDVPENQIPEASQTSLTAWDSIASITLVNVIEEEFEVQMDLDRLADLDSFEKILDYLGQETSHS
jgi:acyl carrier protein